MNTETIRQPASVNEAESKAGFAAPTGYALPGLAQARKIFHDYLDDKRPWATNASMYDAMEQMVDAAASAFRSEHRPTKEEVRELEAALMRFTEPLTEHPENYEGPCLCAECRSNA